MLDAIGIALGADKSSLRAENRCAWDYSRVYEDVFRDIRHDEINVIEIGVAAGASLRMWLRYFDRARIIGIDIIPECAKFAGGRAEVRIGSQDDEIFLRGLAQEFPPTIVIDDGSHKGEHIMKSFDVMFPLLLPGGYYVIEDTAFHFHSTAASLAALQPVPVYPSGTVQEFLNRIVFAKLAYCNTGALYSEIDELRIINGAIFIKKSRPRNHKQTKLALEQELDRHAAQGSFYGFACYRMAEYLMTYHEDPTQALQYIEKGALTWPDNIYGLQLKRKALTELGRRDEAQQVTAHLEQKGARIELAPIDLRDNMTYPHR